MRAQTERTSCSSSLILSEGYNTGTRTHAYMQTHTMYRSAAVWVLVPLTMSAWFMERYWDTHTWLLGVCVSVCLHSFLTLFEILYWRLRSMFTETPNDLKKATLQANPSYSFLNNSLKAFWKLYKNWKTKTGTLPFLKHYKNIIAAFLVWVGDESVGEPRPVGVHWIHVLWVKSPLRQVSPLGGHLGRAPG